jgi:hypothetical protein
MGSRNWPQEQVLAGMACPSAWRPSGRVGSRPPLKRDSRSGTERKLSSAQVP